MRFPFQLSPDKDFDCVGFGENTSDHLLVVHAHPRRDTKTALVENVHTSGGQIASAMVGLARLNLGVAYAGRFGSDAAGASGLASLQEEGINTTRAEIVEAAQTHTSYILIDAKTGARTILYARDERLAYSAEDAPIELAAGGRVLHIDGQNPRAALRLAKAARAAGAIVSADFDFVSDDVLALACEVDVLIASADFPRRAVGMMDEADEYLDRALRDLQERFGCAVVGCTRGAQGATVLANGMYAETPAFAVPDGVRDTTGAGDAFHAGFLYGLLTNESIQDALKIGAAVAVLSCRKLGARDGLPTKDELNDYLTHI